MWMTELLGKEGNKLLKLIEEPPPNTIFIFVAENEQLILPTILSRTQLIKFPMLQTEEIQNALELKYNVDSNKSKLFAYLAKGNFREALHQMNQIEDDWEVTLRDWLNTIVKTGPMAQMKWVEEISKIGREKQKQFLQYFIYLLEQALSLRVRGNQALSQLEITDKVSAEMDFASRFNRLCNIAQQEAIIQELDQSIYHIERNANAKILFHALTIKLYHIISNKSVILVA
jgi:DNA polymerase-3 subunit delta'